MLRNCSYEEMKRKILLLNKWINCANYKLRRNREKQKVNFKLKRKSEKLNLAEKEEREAKLQAEKEEREA